MTRTKRGIQHRALALFVIILTTLALLLSLSSCSTETKFSKSDKESTEEFIARVMSKDSTAKLHFIAASRGYNVTENKYAEKYPDEHKGLSLDKEEDIPVGVTKDAIVVLGKVIIKETANSTSFTSSGDRDLIINYANDLTAEQMQTISKAFGVTYDLSTESAFSCDCASLLAPINLLIGKVLKWLTVNVGNHYVVAILIFAFFVEIAMLPIAIKQQKNSIGMAKLRPKIAKIEKKYAGRTDQATLRKKQEEIMELQQKEGYSPFSGCLPLILQLVIVGFILYPIIQNPLRYMLDTSADFANALLSYATSAKSVGGLGLKLSSKGNVIELLSILKPENMEYITDFALISNGQQCLDVFRSLEIPNFTMFGLNLGEVPKVAFNLMILIPVLNVLVQWASMKLSKVWNSTGMQPAAQDAQSQASMKIMELVGPLMTLFIMFSVPALIGVYWLFRSVVSLLKQYIMKVAMPIPKYTDEEIREMEKAERERQKAQKEALKEQPKYRSLHYIDEDDYEQLPEINKNTGSKKKFDNTEMPEIKD